MKEIFLKTGVLLQIPENRTVRFWAKDQNGVPCGLGSDKATCWCLTGALYHVLTNTERVHEYEIQKQLSDYLFGSKFYDLEDEWDFEQTLSRDEIVQKLLDVDLNA